MTKRILVAISPTGSCNEFTSTDGVIDHKALTMIRTQFSDRGEIRSLEHAYNLGICPSIIIGAIDSVR